MKLWVGFILTVAAFLAGFIVAVLAGALMLLGESGSPAEIEISALGYKIESVEIDFVWKDEVSVKCTRQNEEREFDIPIDDLGTVAELVAEIEKHLAGERK